ncbi:MAG: 4'-phosphopantetheinyl transferase superfamily protein [Lachnospiraceae bacterium]|nr:4'-phosphopantetheinyl transferase superfamily protein [Lachnospiraceae bacterium]
MDSVIKTYIINTRQYEDEAAFNTAVESVSPYRRQKIALLKNVKDKMRSLAAAVALNTALKEYGLEERTMEYDVGKQGKPYFRYNPEIRFSLSHSGDYAICSIGTHETGNDIELIKSGRERVAKRFFATEELDWIYETQDPRERDNRIFRIWTMKESFLKVTGRGMSLPLKDFAVIMSDDGDIDMRQNFNDITYYMKEYAMPETMPESDEYKITVCSEAETFAPELVVL